MEFRPCIDIHNGKVKQIVGSSLKDQNDYAKENFVSEKNADYYAQLYKENGLKGGHVILLNAKDSVMYEETLKQAKMALSAYRDGLQIGGGITKENAYAFLEAGASHVIVTSYVFHEGRIDYDRLEALRKEVGKEHVVLDLSCRKKGQKYYIVTDRWQNMTNTPVTEKTMQELSEYCDEFLVHAVDVEGKASGIEKDCVKVLTKYREKPITYAGGVHSYEDIFTLKEMGEGRIHVTVGSALDLFGGTLSMQKIKDIVG